MPLGKFSPEKILSMKIIAVLEKEISIGGGFNQATNAIVQMNRLCEGRFDFEVFTTRPNNIPYLEKLGLKAYLYNYSITNKLLAQLSTNTWWQLIQSNIKLIGPFEKRLLEHECDLVYFVTPSGTSASLQKLNYITTVWDLCHRDTVVFPEIREFSEFSIRERHYQNNLSAGMLVITDSVKLADLASYRYGIDRERFLPIPFAPAPFLGQEISMPTNDVLSKHNLKPGYFYYPAQFWAHKNHIRILEALLKLKAEGHAPNVVFTGQDYGNRRYLEDFVSKHNLQKQVLFLEFVPLEEMRGLYEGSIAVVMPSYFGPTNLPPLEAWLLKKPLIYSAHLAEHAGDAALLVDPGNADELAAAMMKCHDPAVCSKLIELGKRRMQYFAHQRAEAENDLLERLQQFATQRRCWC